MRIPREDTLPITSKLFDAKRRVKTKCRNRDDIVRASSYMKTLIFHKANAARHAPPVFLNHKVLPKAPLLTNIQSYVSPPVPNHTQPTQLYTGRKIAKPQERNLQTHLAILYMYSVENGTCIFLCSETPVAFW